LAPSPLPSSWPVRVQANWTRPAVPEPAFARRKRSHCSEASRYTIVLFQPCFHDQATVTRCCGSKSRTAGDPVIVMGRLSIPSTRKRTQVFTGCNAGNREIQSGRVGGLPGLWLPVAHRASRRSNSPVALVL
jgi:hypothetical protein